MMELKFRPRLGDYSPALDPLLTLWVGLGLSSLCLLFFTIDVAGDFFVKATFNDSTLHLALELFVVIVAVGAFLFHLYGLVSILRSHRKISKQVRVASGEFALLLEELFASWRLTHAERDVAVLMIKGVSFKEIAQARSSKEGTVKAQANAIYKKAGVAGRNELVALFLDEFLNEVSVASPANSQDPA